MDKSKNFGKDPKDMTEEELMKLLMNAAMFNANKEPTKTENKVTDVLSILNPLAIASLGDVLKELDFVVNCELEGDVEKDRFEPHVKLSFRIGRSMESVMKMKEHELEKLDIESQIVQENERLKIEQTMQFFELQRKAQETSQQPFMSGCGCCSSEEANPTNGSGSC